MLAFSTSQLLENAKFVTKQRLVTRYERRKKEVLKKEAPIMRASLHKTAELFI